MSILKEIKDSFYNPDYYRGLIDQPFGHSLRYYCALILVVSIVVTTLGTILIVPIFNSVAYGVRGVVLSLYPDDLKIDIKNGEVSTNLSEPLIINLPSILSADGDLYDKENLLVIDTAATTTAGVMDKYKTVFFVGRNTLLYDQGASDTTIIGPLATSSNFSFDKPAVDSFLTDIEQYYKYFTPLIVLGLFMSVVLLMLGIMLYLLFIALIIWILAWLNKWDISYLKAYQLSLHFATLGLLLALFSLLLFPGSASLIVFTGTLVILALVTFRSREKDKNLK